MNEECTIAAACVGYGYGKSGGNAIHTLDYAIIIVILAGFVGYGILQSLSNRTAADYFLGNHRVPWFAAMFSIVATETSVLTFISVPGLAYREDWFFLQLALGYILGRRSEEHTV